MHSKALLWLIEDDVSCINIYQDLLDPHYDVTYFKSLSELKRRLDQIDMPDLLIADLMLPDGNFMEFMSECAPQKLIEIPYIVVSSMHELNVLRDCFRDGAIDYLTKPFNSNELMIKVERALAKKVQHKEFAQTRVDPLLMVSHSCESVVPDLTSKELRIFSVLYRNLNQRVSRNKIIMDVWGNVSVGEKTLDVHLVNLRKKLRKTHLTIRHYPPRSFCLTPIRESSHAQEEMA